MTVANDCREIVVGPNFIPAQSGFYLAMAARLTPEDPFDVVETPIIGWNIISHVCPDCRSVENDVNPVTVLPIEDQQPYYIVKQPDGQYLIEGERMFANRDDLIKWLNHSDHASDALTAFLESLGGIRTEQRPATKKKPTKQRAKKETQ